MKDGCCWLRFKEKHGEKGLAPVFAVAQSAEQWPTMTNCDGSLPCFTKTGTSRLVHGDLCRWLTAREKCAIAGLPVSMTQAAAAGLENPVDWRADVGWHQRVGNGQQLQSMGVILVTVMKCLRLKDTCPPSILEISPPSIPDGLAALGGDAYQIDIGGSKFKLNGKSLAMEAHKRLHEPWNNPDNLLTAASLPRTTFPPG